MTVLVTGGGSVGWPLVDLLLHYILLATHTNNTLTVDGRLTPSSYILTLLHKTARQPANTYSPLTTHDRHPFRQSHRDKPGDRWQHCWDRIVLGGIVGAAITSIRTMRGTSVEGRGLEVAHDIHFIRAVIFLNPQGSITINTTGGLRKMTALMKWMS